MRFLLLPLSIFYGFIVGIRNKLFNWKILKNKTFNIPIICVGNISIGGTGKTPHIEYLIKVLSNKKIAVLSRGYGRVTKGVRFVKEDENYLHVGDEPLQIKQKFPKVKVIVSENRRKGVQEILRKFPETEVILMDDGFQHRYLNTGLNIILNNYEKPIYSDYLIPFGGLRESINSLKRAKIIITTKCPKLNEEEKNYISKKVNLQKNQLKYFSSIEYDKCRNLISKTAISNLKGYNILLVTSIANAHNLKNYLEHNQNTVNHLAFPDHHKFSDKNINDILTKFKDNNYDKNIILTTEKDKVKLTNFIDYFKGINIYYIQIKVNIQNYKKFNNEILKYVTNYKREL